MRARLRAGRSRADARPMRPQYGQARMWSGSTTSGFA